MKIIRTLLAAGLCAASVAAHAAEPAAATGDAATPPGFWQNPAVPGYGEIHPLPKAAYQPQPGETYKVVFSVTKAAEKPADTSSALEAVARSVNLYVSAGVPLDHLKFVVILSGAMTDSALDDEHYKQKLGADKNPNLDLIRKLRSAGVDVAVCGQAVLGRKEQYEWVAPEVKVALSALTTITMLQHEGYALMPL